MTLIRRRQGIRGPATIGVQLVAVTLAFAMMGQTASANPTDVTTSPAPVVGADPPKGTEIESGDAKVAPKTGALQYSYPIAVPPGRGAAAPSLSLQYSSQGGLYGGIAAGWTLGGVPEIRREYSRGFHAFDRKLGAGGVPPHDAAEPRWISSMAGGRELIRVDEPYGTDAQASYRAQSDDSYTRYQKALPGMTYSWVALTSDGGRYEFGRPDIEDFDGSAPLTKFIDAFGNTVRYTYETVYLNGDVVDYRLTEVSYSENTAAGLEAHARVTFEYASTTIPCVAQPVGAALLYANGTRRWKGLSQLDAIVTWVRPTAQPSAWQIVRRFVLGYNGAAGDCSAAHTPMRLLETVTETNASGTQLRPAATFGYGAIERSLTGQLTLKFDDVTDAKHSLGHGSRATVNPVISSTLGSQLTDLNADARPDRIHETSGPSAAECVVSWNRNVVSNLPQTSCSAAKCDVHFEASQTSISVEAIPWADGAGLNKGNKDESLGEHCSLTGQYSKQANLTPSGTCVRNNLGHYKFYRFLDLNGDSLPDLVTALHYDATYYDVALPPVSQTPEPPPAPPGVIMGCRRPDAACMANAVMCHPTKGCVYDDSALDTCMANATVEPCFDTAASAEPIYALNTGNGPRPQGLIDDLKYGLPKMPGDHCFPQRTPESAGNKTYRWVVHWGQGDGTFADQGVAIRAPIPLSSHTGDVVSTQGAFTSSSSTHSIIDLDGDGYQDVIFVVKNGPAIWQYWRGDGTGNFNGKANGDPYVWTVPNGAKPLVVGSLDTSGTITNEGLNGLVDVNADGRPDYVRFESGDLRVHYNMGTGFEQIGIVLNMPDARLSKSVTDPIPSGGEADHVTTVRNVDFDGDGRPDWCVDNGSTANMYWNLQGNVTLAHVSTTAAEFQELVRVSEDAWWTKSTTVDLNGDGITDVVSHDGMSLPSTAKTETNNGERRALLKSITNGRGLTIAVDYTSATDKSEVVELGAGRLPRPTWVVSSVTRSDAWNDTGSELERFTYKYFEPEWNQDDDDKWGFRGFKTVETTGPSGSLTVETFDYTDDWSGRGVGTAVFLDGSVDEPHSISATVWQEFSLFDGDSFTEDTLKTFHAKSVTTRTCLIGQSTTACTNSGALLRTDTSWQGLATGGGDPVMMVAEHSIRSEAVSGPVEGDRKAGTTQQLYYDGDTYRLRTTFETRETYDADGWELRGKTQHVWASDGLVKDYTSVWLDPGTIATTSFWHDMATGQLTARRKPEQGQVGGTGATEAYEYGGLFKLFVTKTTNELGHQVETDYDLATGALVSTRGPNIRAGKLEEVRHVLDDLGRPIETYVTVDGPFGTYVDELVSRNTYYDFPTSAVSAGVISENRIDYGGNRWVTVDKRFDGHGRLIRESTVAGEGLNPAINEYDYDAAGNLVRFRTPDPTDNTGHVEYTYAYDAIGRATAMRNPLGDGVNIVWEGLRQQILECESDGTTCVDGTASAAQKYVYKDVYGRTVRVMERRDNGGYVTTWYTYDANDNLAEVKNPENHITTLSHNWVGNRIGITRFGKTWTYTYDRNGNRIGEVMPYPAGASAIDYTNAWAYDDLDRVTSRTNSAAGLSVGDAADLSVGLVMNEYDATVGNGVGRLRRVLHPNNTMELTYVYDGRGRTKVEQASFDFASLGFPQLSDTRSLTYAYNALGQVTDTWHADDVGSGATHTQVSYDDRGLPLTATYQGNVLATYLRNTAGKITSRTSPNSDRSFAYDKLGRVTDDVAVDAGGGIQFGHAFGYNRNGEMATMTSNVAGTTLRNFTFTYDRQHHIKTAGDDQGYSASFTYHGSGKIATANVAVPGTARSALNRNVAYNYSLSPDKQAPDSLWDSSAGTTRGRNHYDDRGNVTQRYVPSETTTNFSYDGFNDMRVASVVGGVSEAYYYAAPGRRMLALRRNASGGVDRLRLWLGNTEIWYAAGGTIDKTWAHVSLGSAIARIQNQNDIQYTHHSMLGSLIVSLNEDGVVLAGYQYGAFGELLESVGDTDEHLRRFNGKEDDAVSALSYYGYRYYDKLFMTWTQSDPLYRFVPDIALDQPERMNLYMFTGNNPIRYVDPDGRDWTGVLKKGVKVGSRANPWVGIVATSISICAGSSTCSEIASKVKDTVVELGSDLLDHALGENYAYPTAQPREVIEAGEAYEHGQSWMGGKAGGNGPKGKTLTLPQEKAGNIKDYKKAAQEGKLVRQDPKTKRKSGFRRRLSKAKGTAPASGMDADHKVELCVGGADCAETNGQWLDSGPNRAAGAKIGGQVRDDPVGTVYTDVKVE